MGPVRREQTSDGKRTRVGGLATVAAAKRRAGKSRGTSLPDRNARRRRAHDRAEV
jgi:hypothetical protein